MRKKIFIAIFAVILTGCGKPSQDCVSSPISSSVPQTTASQLTLEPSQNMYVTIDQIDQYYQHTEKCTGVFKQGPQVYFRDLSSTSYAAVWGLTYLDSGIIVINTNPGPGLMRTCATDKQALEHEFVHYLLNTSDHTNKYFAECTG